MCHCLLSIFSTLKAPKRLRARNRASGAIDGGAPTPDCKPSGLNRRRLATVTLRVFRSRRRHGNSPFGRKTRSGTRFNPSVFFARRANFRVAGEAENRPSGRFGFASVSAFSVSNRREGQAPFQSSDLLQSSWRTSCVVSATKGASPSLGVRIEKDVLPLLISLKSPIEITSMPISISATSIAPSETRTP